MRAWPLKVAAQYAGGLVIAAFFVVLLSFIFSFLGTIFCAALGGMMLGALRTRKWLCIPVSLLFPLVISTLMRGMKTELDGRQILVVSLACFLVFWLTYAVAAALFFSERKVQPASSGRSQVEPVPNSAPGSAAPGEAASAPGTESPKRNGWLSLEMLEGNWSAEGGAQPQRQHKRLSVEKEKLILSVEDSAGQVRILARAQLKLCGPDATPTLVVSKAPPDSADSLVSI